MKYFKKFEDLKSWEKEDVENRCCEIELDDGSWEDEGFFSKSLIRELECEYGVEFKEENYKLFIVDDDNEGSKLILLNKDNSSIEIGFDEDGELYMFEDFIEIEDILDDMINTLLG